MEAFLGDWRPDYWISDRYGGQMGWAKREHQVCLAHLIRDVQYAVDEGDAVFAPGLKGLLKRACAIGRRRDALSDSTLKIYEADLNRRLDRLMSLIPTHKAGGKLQKIIKKVRRHLFVFVTNRDVYIMITIRNIMAAFSTNVVIVCSLRVLYVVSFNVNVVVSVVVVADMVAC